MNHILTTTRGLRTLTAIALGSLFYITGVAAAADTQEWDKTFPKSDKVIHEKVSYPNRNGINVAADMYLPKNIDKSNKYPALIVGTPLAALESRAGKILKMAVHCYLQDSQANQLLQFQKG